MLVRDYSLRLHQPKCDPFAEVVNAFGLLPDDVTEALPYLNAVITGCIYNPHAPGLCFRKEGHTISVYPRQLGVSKCADEEEARRVLDWLRDTINDVWERRDSIEPNYTAGRELTALEVYKLLPRTNCGDCGEPTCLAFAAKLVMQETEIARCGPLFSGEHEENRQSLVERLVALGYEVPEELI